MSSPVLARQAGTRLHHVRLLGTGAATPTKEIGQSVTVSRTAAGVYKLTWGTAQHPGTFLTMSYALGASTAADVKGQTLTRGLVIAATATAGLNISVSLWDSTFAADDLQTTEYIDLVFCFKTVSV